MTTRPPPHRPQTPAALLRDFLAHPLRIFFLSLPLAIIAAALPWLLTALGLPTPVAALPYHLYIFIDISAAAAYGGFLLTALISWTDYRRPILHIATALFILWLAALLGAAYPASRWLLAAYWLGLLAFAASLTWRDRRQDSLLYSLTLINLLHLAYTLSGDARHLHAMLHIHLIALMVVQFRVGMVIGNEALQEAMNDRARHPGRYPAWLLAATETPRFIPNPIAKNLAGLCLSILALSVSLDADPILQGWLALSACGALIANLQAWHHRILLRRVYVRAFYAAILLPALGYLGYSLARLGGYNPLYGSAALHAIAIGGFLLMTLNIMHIAGLRHSGQTLHYTATSRAAFALVILAALSRSLLSPLALAHLPHAYLAVTYALPALSLSAAFILYALRYYPIFRDYPATDGE